MERQKRKEMEQEALSHAKQGMTLTNYPAIFQGFMEKGIPEDDIKPRENGFTYHAWRALGRQVKRGEHGVKIVTFVPIEKEVQKNDGTTGTENFRRPWSATVFHVSQTEAIN